MMISWNILVDKFNQVNENGEQKEGFKVGFLTHSGDLTSLCSLAHSSNHPITYSNQNIYAHPWHITTTFFLFYICFKIALSSSGELSRMILSHTLNVRENIQSKGGGVGAPFELWGRCGAFIFLTKEEKEKEKICSYTWIGHLVIGVIQNFIYDLLKNIFFNQTNFDYNLYKFWNFS